MGGALRLTGTAVSSLMAMVLLELSCGTGMVDLGPPALTSPPTTAIVLLDVSAGLYMGKVCLARRRGLGGKHCQFHRSFDLISNFCTRYGTFLLTSVGLTGSGITTGSGWTGAVYAGCVPWFL